MNKNLRFHFFALLVQIIYAANFSIAKEVMPQYIQPFGFIVLRVLPTAFLFFVIAYFVGEEKIRREDKLRLVLCAVFGVAINQLLFFKGLNLTSPINGALIMTTNPVLVMLMAAFILKEKISVNKIMGIALGIIGAATLILFGKKFSLSSAGTLGDLFIFINSVSFAYFMVIAKPLMQRYHPLTISKWMFLMGSFMVLPFGFSEITDVQWNSIPANGWLCICFVVIGVTFVAYLLNAIALRNLSPAVVSSYIYVQPAFATLFSILLGQGNPNWLHLLCAVLIFTGVYLVTKKEKQDVQISKS